ncbi:MAG: hypothetical protein WC650_01290 [Candidatus Doudnabacteria bacterium]
MNLKEFISKTINDIVEGVEEASEKLKGKNKEIGIYSAGSSDQRHIEFDVAVTVDNKNKNEKSGGGGIRVLSIVQVSGGLQAKK